MSWYDLFVGLCALALVIGWGCANAAVVLTGYTAGGLTGAGVAGVVSAAATVLSWELVIVDDGSWRG